LKIEEVVKGKIYKIGDKYFEVSNMSNDICMNCHKLKEGMMVRLFVQDENGMYGEIRFCEECAKELGWFDEKED